MPRTKLPWTSRDVGGTHFAGAGGPVLACFWLILACFWPIFAHWGGWGLIWTCAHWPLFAALNGSRGGVSRSIVRMVRDHARRITRATFSKPHHPDWVSLEAPPSTRKHRPPRTPLKPTFQNDKSLIDTQSDSLCTSEPTARNVTLQPVRRHTFLRSSSIAFCSASATTGPTS